MQKTSQGLRALHEPCGLVTLEIKYQRLVKLARVKTENQFNYVPVLQREHKLAIMKWYVIW